MPPRAGPTRDGQVSDQADRVNPVGVQDQPRQDDEDHRYRGDVERDAGTIPPRMQVIEALKSGPDF